MFTLNGKYNSLKVFTDNCDAETQSQLMTLLNQPFVEGSQIRIMPDCHKGKGCVIGTTMTIKDKVCANLCGVDIGCGVLVARLDADDIDFEALDSVIDEYIPSGMNVHATEQFFPSANLSHIKAPVNISYALQSIGTLGGGNHFIEVDKDDKGLLLVVHTGSRHLGIEICEHYQNLAIKRLTDKSAVIRETVERLKAEGRTNEISSAIEKIKQEAPSTPKDLAYIEGQDLEDYLHDMAIAQKFAATNRQRIVATIAKSMDIRILDIFDTIHNYIDTENRILRKGSVSAKKGERLIIPINMRDGSLICIGEGNPDWNYSAPHGAGRILSRSKAKEQVSMEDYKQSMEGIYTTCVNESTIDESAFAYKPMDEIMDNIRPTVEIESVIKPVYNYKAGEHEMNCRKSRNALS